MSSTELAVNLKMKFGAMFHYIVLCTRLWQYIMILKAVKRHVSDETIVIFLANLSRRLMGELIGYPCSGVRPSYVVRTSSSSSKISNIFFSQSACPIRPKFYVEPLWVGGTKVCSRHLGHMTKMAATLIYGKNLSKSFFSRTGGPIFTKLGM